MADAMRHTEGEPVRRNWYQSMEGDANSVLSQAYPPTS